MHQFSGCVSTNGKTVCYIPLHIIKRQDMQHSKIHHSNTRGNISDMIFKMNWLIFQHSKLHKSTNKKMWLWLLAEENVV
jgi:hypothetical protein